MPRRGAGTEGESQSNKDQFHIFHDCNELGGFKIICRLHVENCIFYFVDDIMGFKDHYENLWVSS